MDLRGPVSPESLREVYRLTDQLFEADVWASRASARELMRRMFGPSVKSEIDLTEQMARALIRRMLGLLQAKRGAEGFPPAIWHSPDERRLKT